MTSFQDRILTTEATDPFLWIVVVGALGAFFAAFGIGANDVANAFATSVGAKAITLRQAILYAAVFEFLGALLMGRGVMKTIREGIAEVDCFMDNPGILMYGMCCVVYTTGVWLLLASHLEMPVSTTHSTVGGIVGMAMAYGGGGCVNWYEEKDMFPYMGGVAAIVTSWVLSPLFSGIISVALFVTVRQLVLRSPYAFSRALLVYPILVIATISVNVFFILCKSSMLEGFRTEIAFAWAFGLGCCVTLLTTPAIIPYIKRVVKRKFDDAGTPIVENEALKECGTEHSGIMAYISGRMDQDLHAAALESQYVSEMHGNAEMFDYRVEEVFKYLQVVTAICDSFSHGANDIANATGPFAAIYMVYVHGKVGHGEELGDDSYWILAMGGFGIVVGLALYGYKIIAAIGVKIAKITPSRGFTIELGTAITIILGTRIGMPLSTTHCQVGSAAGVALLEGIGGLNIQILFKAIVGWAATIVVCALICALLFAQGAYAPHVGNTF